MTINRNTRLQQLHELNLISMRTYHALVSKGIDNLGALCDYIDAGYSLLEIRSFGRKCMFEVNEFLRKFNSNELLDNDEAPAEIEVSYQALPDIGRTYLHKRFITMCTHRLSVRAQHLLDKLDDPLLRLLCLHGHELKDYNTLCPGQYNHKTISELYAFSPFVMDLFLHVCEICLDENKDLLDDALIESDCPYLICTERHFVRKYTVAHGHRPIFYLLLCYFRSSTERADEIFSMSSEIKDGTFYSLKQLGQTYHLSRERIRQLLYSYSLPLERVGISTNDISAYTHLMAMPYIGETCPEAVSIMKDERLDCTWRAFTALCVLCLNFTFLKLGHTYFPIIVRRDVADEIYQYKILHTLSVLANNRYNEDATVSVDHLLLNVPCNRLTKLRAVLVHLATTLYNLRVDESGYIHLTKNHTDVEFEVYKILLAAGRPMHIDELLVQFNEVCPSHRFHDVEQVKCALRHSTRVRPRGKSGTYALTEWTDVYFGCIRDRLLELLEGSDVPLSIDVLINDLRQHYPTTTSASLEANMLHDVQERFILFEGGYYGLASKCYDSSFKPLPLERRFTFEQQINDFRNFVDTHHHLPFTQGEPREESLARWRKNVMSGAVSVTEAQRKEFDEMCQAYHSSSYPMNKKEYKFLCMCKELRSYIEEHHTLPTSVKGGKMYVFLQRAKARPCFGDKRDKYFKDLKNAIQSMGLFV